MKPDRHPDPNWGRAAPRALLEETFPQLEETFPPVIGHRVTELVLAVPGTWYRWVCSCGAVRVRPADQAFKFDTVEKAQRAWDDHALETRIHWRAP